MSELAGVPAPLGGDPLQAQQQYAASSSGAALQQPQTQQQQQQQFAPLQQQREQQQQQPPPALPPQPRQLGRVAEVCVDLLLAEAVATFAGSSSGMGTGGGAAAGQQQRGGVSPAGAAALQAIGFRVGRQLAERYTRDRPRLGDTLDAIKFVCKDFWAAAFRKQVDNLKTNHRGIYVLQDNCFTWVQRVEPPAPPPEGVGRAEQRAALAAPYLELPCGVIRGALAHLGIACSVEADARALPSCSFTVKIAG